ncbi:hypothetical protein CLV58_1067 [Spirosoma oryzae]|uniref:DNA polymerase-3 subunit beta n=1 Tax=Spirosoma oryzae TaxID=1469603 RepID=A0A2T0T5C4_9BACT|nr:hypothetical protein [Spirosoma oryzae]PRY40824.1 hypothetical protein CLV58_1067 [Spirosoma oryzae]
MTTSLTSQVRIGQKELLAALRVVKSVTKDNPTIPAYAYALIKAYPSGAMTIMGGTDTRRLTIRMAGAMVDMEEDESELAYCPELKPTLDLLAATPSGLVWLEEVHSTEPQYDSVQLRLSSSVGDAKLAGMTPSDYPRLTITKGEPDTLVLGEGDALLLAAALERAGKFCLTSTDIYPHLAGVWIKAADGKLSLEASDVYTATIETLDIPWTYGPILIPSDSIDGVVSVLSSVLGGGETAQATLKLLPSWLGVDTSEQELWVRLYDYRPVEMSALFPLADQLDVTWEEDRAVLLGTLARITAMPGLTIKGGTLGTHIATLTSERIDYADESGSYQIEQPIEGWDGPELDWICGVDVKRFIPVIKQTLGTSVAIRLSSSGRSKALLIEESGRRTLLMANFIR